MADYDAGEVTDRERTAAEHQKEISSRNVKDVLHQLSRQLSNYDFADRQNRALADTQLKQNSRKNSEDRFEAQRDLQSSALGLMGSLGSGMNGSNTGNLMRMLESRNDKDNNTFWSQHQVNQDQVENNYNDSLNQNNVSRRDAMQNAEKSIRDIEADYASNLNNINPNLFKKPGRIGDDDSLSSLKAWDESKAKQNNAQISGYIRPDLRGNTVTQTGNLGAVPQRNRLGGNDYFSQLMNRFNGR